MNQDLRPVEISEPHFHPPNADRSRFDARFYAEPLLRLFDLEVRHRRLDLKKSVRPP
jgi:hypothetical protein